MVAYTYDEGMTVTDLKTLLATWPEADEYGEPCTVWIGHSNGLSDPVTGAMPLNPRENEAGTLFWSDLILEYE
jgi:hypothetical protein